MNFVTSRLTAERPLSTASRAAEAFVCWSRMQAEAGQPLEAIVHRKELERRANGGLFVWGVGNAPSRFTRVLARTGQPVRAIFSIMKSRPRQIDVAADELLLWRSYIDAEGIERLLPADAVVTSRASTGRSAKRVHYALMCHSDRPLVIERGGARFDPAAFRNAGEGGGPVGSSQVTALLRQVAKQRDDAAYEVNMEAQLVAGYWVRVTSPVRLARAELKALNRAETMGIDAWRELARRLRRGGERIDSEGTPL